MSIETRKLSELRPHPENANLFDLPDECDEYADIRASIKKHGLWEPIVIKEDGTILSGHLRANAMLELGHTDIKCRVMAFPTYRAEVTFVVRSNTDRRQLKPSQAARAFEILKRLPAEQGGAKRKMGRPEKCAASGTLSRSRDDAAKSVGIGRHEAEALSTVFNAPKESNNDVEVHPAVDVPSEVQQAVEHGKISPTAAAKQIKAERKRQGGTIADPTILKTWVDEKTAPKERRPPSHEERVEQLAQAFNRDVLRMANIYKDLDDLLSHRPLQSVNGPSEHQRYSGLVRDVAIRCARELETVQASEGVGRQVSLIAIPGGKS